MAEIINLRSQRKRKARAEKEKQAEANRIKHGMPKALHKINAAREDKDARDLDGKKLD